ncbi:hypothetical protein [Stenotrophomonas sp. RIT309]|uniref:hypothetical protein n=1 Tax=Stenotrophomonas sp. RIT309 TaxID=1470590 RepID=UPI001378A4B6|nr:hypothetical protein [Stenotrophomonas sp. RIT309]
MKRKLLRRNTLCNRLQAPVKHCAIRHPAVSFVSGVMPREESHHRDIFLFTFGI